MSSEDLDKPTQKVQCRHAHKVGCKDAISHDDIT